MKYACSSWKSVASSFLQRYRMKCHMKHGSMTFCIAVCRSCGRPGHYPRLLLFPSFVAMPVSYPVWQHLPSPSLGHGSLVIWTFTAHITNSNHSFMDYLGGVAPSFAHFCRIIIIKRNKTGCLPILVAQACVGGLIHCGQMLRPVEVPVQVKTRVCGGHRKTYFPTCQARVMLSSGLRETQVSQPNKESPDLSGSRPKQCGSQVQLKKAIPMDAPRTVKAASLPWGSEESSSNFLSLAMARGLESIWAMNVHPGLDTLYNICRARGQAKKLIISRWRVALRLTGRNQHDSRRTKAVKPKISHFNSYIHNRTKDLPHDCSEWDSSSSHTLTPTTTLPSSCLKVIYKAFWERRDCEESMLETLNVEVFYIG